MTRRAGFGWLMMAMCIGGAGCGHSGSPLPPVTGPHIVPVEARSQVRVVPAPQSLDRRPQPLVLTVNVPAFRLDVYRGDSVLARYPVAVGSARYPTPLGTFVIAEIVWNPWWVPPTSEWAVAERVTPPGPANPMGKVKMRFDGDYYVHGTLDSASLGSAASHGCVRVANPDIVRVARLIHESGFPGLSAQEIDGLVNLRPEASSQRILLPRPVQLTIRYERVVLDGQELVIYPDIYGVDSLPIRDQIVAALAAAGLDSTTFDEHRWSDLTIGVGSKVLAVPVDSMMRRGHR